MNCNRLIFALMGAAGLASAAWGQAQPTDVKPAEKPVQQPAPPSLDELLGITKQKPADNKPAEALPADSKPVQPADPARADLERRLQDPNVAEDFVQAVALMKETSDRLTAASDVGLETQRLQQEVLMRLDKMIDEAKKNSKSKKSKSKPDSNQDQDQQQNQQQEQSSQQQKAQQQGQETAASAQGGNVPRQNAQLKPPPAGASASWGDLPPHMRDALLQGFSDKFSATYEQLTQEYYKRLAEQKPSGNAPPATSPPPPAPKPAPDAGGSN